MSNNVLNWIVTNGNIYKEYDIPMLYIYLSEKSKYMLILCVHKYTNKLYKLNLDTDEIENGQWCYGKIVLSKTYVDKDISHIWYKMTKKDEIYYVCSEIPFFTAKKIFAGTYMFNKSSSGLLPMPEEDLNINYCAKSGDTIQIKYNNNDIKLDIIEGIIKKNGNILLDTTNDKYENIASPYPPCARLY